MQLDDVIPWGRTLQEYRAMFSLSKADLSRTILGCGDGPASFNAEMTQLGHSVISIDPIYQFSGAQIEQRVRATYDTVVSQVRQHASQYVWQSFRDADQLGQARLRAMGHFLSDYEAGQAAGRYLNQALPSLAFADNQFDLCLCSHLLFLYSEQRSREFHIASVHELLRVAAEVRVFPLIQLNGQPSPYVESVIDSLPSERFRVQIEAVDYEFQKGGNQMLKISRRAIAA